MKMRILLSLLLILVLALDNQIVVAQDEDTENDGFDITNPMDEQSILAAALNYANIGGKNLVGFRMTPELSLGKLGLGLDVPLMFNLTDKTFYTDEFTSGVGYLRMVRYVRWGVKKRDAFYIRVGDISDAYLGYGILINNYTNAVSFEKRKLGLEFDIRLFKMFGLEFLYTDLDFTSLNLMGVRPYIRPLGRSGIPIIKTFEIGASYVVDKDNTAILTDSSIIKNNYLVRDGVNAWATDAGLVIFNRPWLQLKAYAQYAHLNQAMSDSLSNYISSAAFAADHPELTPEDIDFARGYRGSSGMSIGADFKFKFLGNVLRIDSRLERLWYDDYFMPQFFDAAYEMNKDAKLISLATTRKKMGIFGSLSVTVLNKIAVSGGLMIPDEVTETSPAMLQMNLDASQLFEKWIITGSYFRGDITDLKDAIKIDEKSLLTARLAYKLNKFLILGLDYKWTFATTVDGGFETTNYISPYFGLHLPTNLNELFGIGGKSNNGDDDEFDDLD